MPIVTIDREAVRVARQQAGLILEECRNHKSASESRRNQFQSWRESTSPPPGPSQGGSPYGSGYDSPTGGGQGQSLPDWRLQSWEGYGLGAIARWAQDCAYALDDLRDRARVLIETLVQVQAGAAADALQAQFGALGARCADAIERLTFIGNNLAQDQLDQIHRAPYAMIEAFIDAAGAMGDFISQIEQLVMWLLRMEQQEEVVETALRAILFTAMESFFFGGSRGGVTTDGLSPTVDHYIQDGGQILEHLAGAGEFVLERLAKVSEDDGALGAIAGWAKDIPELGPGLQIAGLIGNILTGDATDPTKFVAHIYSSLLQMEPHVALASAVVGTVSLIDKGASWVTSKIAGVSGRFQGDWNQISADWGQAGQNLNAGKVLDDAGAIFRDMPGGPGFLPGIGDPRRLLGDFGGLANDGGHLLLGVVQTDIALPATVTVGALNLVDAGVDRLPVPGFVKSGVDSATGFVGGGISDVAGFVAHPHFPPWG